MIGLSGTLGGCFSEFRSFGVSEFLPTGTLGAVFSEFQSFGAPSHQIPLVFAKFRSFRVLELLPTKSPPGDRFGLFQSFQSPGTQNLGGRSCRSSSSQALVWKVFGVVRHPTVLGEAWTSGPGPPMFGVRRSAGLGGVWNSEPDFRAGESLRGPGMSVGVRSGGFQKLFSEAQTRSEVLP
jgi:hypothetical protein